MTTTSMVCVRNDLGDASGQDLRIGSVYEVVAFEQGMVRVLDDSGEDYLNPVVCFASVTQARRDGAGEGT